MILLKFYKNILVSVVKLSLASIFIIASFYACTDYETILEDDWNEWVEKKNDFSYGSVIDNRDGHEYKTIVIGNQEWMAENLNYDMKNSSCYDGVEYNCTIYGHLYAFVAANIACFEGWHLPSSEEWEKLFDYVGGSNIAGVKLKSVNGWKNHGKGADEYGFAVLPVGYRSSEYMGFSNRGLSAEFWSSTIKGATMADRAFFSYEDDKAYLKPYYRDYRYSVRCVKDEFVEQESSSSVVLSSDSHEESSSSIMKSSDSSSSTISSSDSHEESSSSIMKSSDSSSSTISSSDSLENSSSFENIVSSSGNRDSVTSSSSENVKLSSSGKASWTYLNPAISYGEMTDDRDGQVYKTVVIGEQTWMAENLNLETGNSYCYNDSTKYCDKYGRLYTWADALEACPADWHLPDSTESEKLLSTVGGEYVAGTNLKSISDWVENGNGGVDTYGFSAIPAGYKSKEGEYGGLSEYANFWLSAEYSSEKGRLMFFYYGGRGGMIGYNYKNELYSIRCLKNETPKSSSSITSSSSKASWAYLNPSYSYGEMTDDRDGQVYKTVEIGEQTWMAENLNYESVRSFCYENQIDSCSKYGRLYTWSAAMDSVGDFSTNSKGCGYPQECVYSKYPVRGVCPEKWHLPSQQEWYNLATYNSSTIGGDLSSAGERLKSANGWFNSGNGENVYGFSAQPGGSGNGEAFSNSGKSACFWTSSDGNGVDAYGVHFEYSDGEASLSYTIKYVGCSVRCVKD